MSTDARLRKIRARLGSLLRELDDEPPAKLFVIFGDSVTDQPGPVADCALTDGSDVLLIETGGSSLDL
jgi:hypothetical protein